MATIVFEHIFEHKAPESRCCPVTVILPASPKVGVRRSGHDLACHGKTFQGARKPVGHGPTPWH